MEIIPIFIQSVPEIPSLVSWVLSGCVVAIAIRCLQRAWTHRRLPSFDLPATLSLSALPLFIAQGAVGSTSSVQNRQNPVKEVQTSPALGERIPLLSPPARAGEASGRVHPAIHRDRRSLTTERLFPPAALKIDEPLAPWERGAIDLRRSSRHRFRTAEHANGSRPDPNGTTSHHVVVSGDTLWDIAAEVLGTDDQRAIARYWPRIHKENFDVLGRDPNLIRPGQVLSLPPREDA